jgi:hypothetical protein
VHTILKNRLPPTKKREQEICWWTDEQNYQSIKKVSFPKSAVGKGNIRYSRSQWPRGLRRRSATALLVRMWVQIPPRERISVSFECCVLSGRDFGVGPNIRSEESYRLWCVVECDLETSCMKRPWPALGCRAKKKKKQLPLSQRVMRHGVQTETVTS